MRIWHKGQSWYYIFLLCRSCLIIKCLHLLIPIIYTDGNVKFILPVSYIDCYILKTVDITLWYLKSKLISRSEHGQEDVWRTTALALLDLTGCPGSVITVLMLSILKVQYCDNWRMAAILTSSLTKRFLFFLTGEKEGKIKKQTKKINITIKLNTEKSLLNPVLITNCVKLLVAF